MKFIPALNTTVGLPLAPGLCAQLGDLPLAPPGRGRGGGGKAGEHPWFPFEEEKMAAEGIPQGLCVTTV